MFAPRTVWKFTPVTQDVLHGPRPLRQVNQYLLRQKIGRGASSHVYLAVDQLTSETYAVKRIKLVDLIRSSVGLTQLEREIRLMRLLRHPNSLRLIEVLHVPSHDEVFLVLEHASNGSVGGFLERGACLSPHAIFSILKQVTTALRYLHSAGYVHQDVKPCNILIDRHGRVMLADFGIGHSFASAGMVVGSPAYQAPEALDDEPGLRGEPEKEDVWALGVTLYQLLFGELPFHGSTLFEIVNDIRERPLTLPAGTDPGVVELLRGMLRVDPVSRIGIDELLGHPLIKEADDLAADLPEVPPVEMRDGEILEMRGEVCGDACSFADVGLAVRRRSSYATLRASEKCADKDRASRSGSWGIELPPWSMAFGEAARYL
jgi:serine/threonine protein kinase